MDGMTGTERSQARRAHKDLSALLEAIKWEHGRETARTAAQTIRTAARDGQLDGCTYGSTSYDGTQVACVLGWVTVTILGDTCFGDSPHGLEAFYQTDATGHAVGSRVENYVMDIERGDTPATNHRAANIARWCAAYVKANDYSLTRS